MSSQQDYFHRWTQEEWDEARRIRRMHDVEIARRAIVKCQKLLAETEAAEDVPRETPEPCEHDYQPSSTFSEALECTLCGTMCEAPERDRDWFDEANQGKL